MEFRDTCVLGMLSFVVLVEAHEPGMALYGHVIEKEGLLKPG